MYNNIYLLLLYRRICNNNKYSCLCKTTICLKYYIQNIVYNYIFICVYVLYFSL